MQWEELHTLNMRLHKDSQAVGGWTRSEKQSVMCQPHTADWLENKSILGFGSCRKTGSACLSKQAVWISFPPLKLPKYPFKSFWDDFHRQLKLQWNGRSNRYFLLYCDLHPSDKDYRKRKNIGWDLVQCIKCWMDFDMSIALKKWMWSCSQLWRD